MDFEKLEMLNYEAFVQIRALASQTNPEIHAIAYLMHNLPLELLATRNGQLSIQEVERRLHARAKGLGLEDWLSQSLQNTDSQGDIWKKIQ